MRKISSSGDFPIQITGLERLFRFQVSVFFENQFRRTLATCPELVEDVGDKKKQFHSREAFAEADPLADGERTELVDFAQLTASVEEALGAEALRFLKDSLVEEYARDLRHGNGAGFEQVPVHVDVSHCTMVEVLW